LGIALGSVISTSLTQFPEWPTDISGSTALGSFAFAAFIGIFFGWYRLAGRPRSIRWMLFELKNRERHRRFTHYPAKHLKRGFDNPA